MARKLSEDYIKFTLSLSTSEAQQEIRKLAQRIDEWLDALDWGHHSLAEPLAAVQPKVAVSGGRLEAELNYPLRRYAPSAEPAHL